MRGSNIINECPTHLADSGPSVSKTEQLTGIPDIRALCLQEQKMPGQGKIPCNIAGNASFITEALALDQKNCASCRSRRVSRSQLKCSGCHLLGQFIICYISTM